MKPMCHLNAIIASSFLISLCQALVVAPQRGCVVPGTRRSVLTPAKPYRWTTSRTLAGLSSSATSSGESRGEAIARELASVGADGVVAETASACLASLTRCKEQALLHLWDSEADDLRYRPTSLAALDELGLGGGALGVTTDDGMEDLRNALAAVVFLSSLAAVVVGSLIGGNLGASLTWLLVAVVPDPT